MELVELKGEQLTATVSEDELYIIHAAVGEIYAGVCVDAREFQNIHGTNETEVLKLHKKICELYDRLIESKPHSNHFL